MPMGIRRAGGAALVALGAVVAALAAAPAWADSVATSGPATSVASNSATLNGVVDSPDPNSSWTFEYGTTTGYTHVLDAHSIDNSLRAVSLVAAGLAPSTTYHYRLVVLQGSYPQKEDDGGDMSFTTPAQSSSAIQTPAPPKYGKASAAGKRLKVKHGVVSIPFKCAGAPGAACNGKISLTMRTRPAGTSPKTVRCGNGSFVASAGHSHTVRAAVGSQCDSLLQSATDHSLGAVVKGVFTTHQTPLRIAVTLVGT